MRHSPFIITDSCCLLFLFILFTVQFCLCLPLLHAGFACCAVALISRHADGTDTGVPPLPSPALCTNTCRLPCPYLCELFTAERVRLRCNIPRTFQRTRPSLLPQRPCPFAALREGSPVPHSDSRMDGCGFWWLVVLFIFAPDDVHCNRRCLATPRLLRTATCARYNVTCHSVVQTWTAGFAASGRSLYGRMVPFRNRRLSVC